jgi:acid phosphatase type 7
MKKINTFFIVFLLLSSIGFSQNINVTRGPYLQVNASTSIVIKWSTNLNTDSKVTYGKSLTALDSTIVLTDSVSKHEVKIENLEPFTKYYYTIGTSTEILDGPEESIHFVTAPVPGTEQPVRVWAIGDFGKGNQGQKDARDAYLDYVGNDLTNVWIWLGDNAYNDGTDQEYQDKVFDSTYSYQKIFKHMPFWPSPGNHDYNSVCAIPCFQSPLVHGGAYYDIITVPENGEAGGVASGVPLYYSFDYANVHFLSLNSEIASPTSSHDWIGVYGSSGWNNSPFKQWLENDLQQNTKPWVVAYWHQVPFSKGSHDSDDAWEIYMSAMRRRVVPLLESYGVDLIVTGHSHVYERSYLMNGFYGNSNELNPAVHILNNTSGKEDLGEPYIKYTTGPKKDKGTVYVVSGNAGSQTTSASMNHPIMYTGDHGSGAYGSFVMEFNGNRMDGFYVKSDSTIGDYFTILKEEDSSSNGLSTYKPTNLKIYPQPFKDILNISYTLKMNENINVDLYDLSGRKVKSIHSGSLAAGVQNHYLDASSLDISNGMYLIGINNGNDTYFEKIIKME